MIENNNDWKWENMITLQIFKENELIIKENDIDEHLYLIESGKVKVYTESNGKEVMLAKLSQGDFFGDPQKIPQKFRGLPKACPKH